MELQANEICVFHSTRHYQAFKSVVLIYTPTNMVADSHGLESTPAFRVVRFLDTLQSNSRKMLLWFWLLTTFFLFFFGGTGVWVQGRTLARQALYCLSHSASHFCSFEDFFMIELFFLLICRYIQLYISYIIIVGNNTELSITYYKETLWLTVVPLHDVVKHRPAVETVLGILTC
jgi:hypothetical protein